MEHAEVAEPLSPEVKNWAMIAHVSSWIGAWVALAFMGPLVIWLLKKDEHPFIEEHAREATNFGISILIYVAISIVLMLVLIGFVLIVFVGLLFVVASVRGAMKAANGQSYRYPLTLRFIS